MKHWLVSPEIAARSALLSPFLNRFKGGVPLRSQIVAGMLQFDPITDADDGTSAICGWTDVDAQGRMGVVIGGLVSGVHLLAAEGYEVGSMVYYRPDMRELDLVASGDVMPIGYLASVEWALPLLDLNVPGMDTRDFRIEDDGHAVYLRSHGFRVDGAERMVVNTGRQYLSIYDAAGDKEEDRIGLIPPNSAWRFRWDADADMWGPSEYDVYTATVLLCGLGMPIMSEESESDPPAKPARQRQRRPKTPRK